jgi:hypothetical protein
MAGGFLHMPALLAKNHAADGLTVRKENNDRIRRRNHASPQLGSKVSKPSSVS